MKIEAKDDGWWITHTPQGVEEMGPYATRRQAREDRHGVARFLRITQRSGSATAAKDAMRANRSDRHETAVLTHQACKIRTYVDSEKYSEKPLLGS